MLVFMTILYYFYVTSGNIETNPGDSLPTTENSTDKGPSNRYETYYIRFAKQILKFHLFV